MAKERVGALLVVQDPASFPAEHDSKSSRQRTRLPSIFT
jgi:hypothetical protein